MKLPSPAILDRARELVIERFGKSVEDIRDGMDISLCAYNKESGSLQWSGANNPLWIIRNGNNSIEEIIADKQPIGMYATIKPFTNHIVQLKKGDSIYIFSDGFADQFGGPNGKKYKSAQLKNFLLSIQDVDMDAQHNLLLQEFKNWKGNFEQIDDVCIMGVKI